MKNIKLILVSFLLIGFLGCEEDERGTDFVDDAVAPSEVLLEFRTTQDNSGAVTITPTAIGATKFNIQFGDGTGNAVLLDPGQSVDNVYSEGTYTVRVTATSINGLTTEAEQQLVVSFEAPQNLVVTIENDAALSKQVNVTATADFAMSYDVYFGEPGIDTPVTGNIGDTVSYTYQDAGTYTITVIAMGSAIETTMYTEDFEVTEILAPITSAATPPTRADGDVISIFSDAYTDIAGTDFFPNWGQSTIYTAFDLNGDAIIQYSNLNYEGINIGESVDASSMETLHIDIWTPDATTIDIFPLPNGVQPADERFVTRTLVPNEWNSFDIPMEDFTSQGLPVNDLLQFKFVGSGTVFIDNLYFYRESGSAISCGSIGDFEGTPPTFTVFGNIADTQVVANPDMTGENTTANVAQLTKTNGSEVWAGTFFDIASPIDFSTCTMISVKTWSPKVGAVVKLKIEDSTDGNQSFEVDLNTSVANAWEELTYDFSAAPAFNYDRVVIFFDFGVAGDDSVYYYDEIELVGSGGGPAPLGFQDFEGTPPMFTVFGNIADTQVVANPDMSGANTTGNVAQLTKTNGSEVWAGTFFDVATALDMTTYSKIRMKVWSPKVGAVVKLKIEDSTDGNQSFEVDLTTSVANAWEELTYDFSAAPMFNYDRVVVFFDFGEAGDDSVYYYDEMELTN